jgi:hypothetical protein
MQHDSMIPADQLELKGRFDVWRANREYQRETTPEELRQAASEMCRRYPPALVGRVLKLDPSVTRRFSQGRLRWWPEDQDTPLHPLGAQQLSVLLYQGLPDQAEFAPPWRRLPNPDAQAARASDSSPR